MAVTGVVALVLMAFAAVRIVLGQTAPSQAAPPDSLESNHVTTENLSASAIEPSLEVVPAPQPARRPIKFSSKPIEPSYTVQSGDSLSTIALRNNSTAEAIQAINNLPDRAVLSVGQRLVIP